ncbi:MAG: prepilin-type N-terminal cleavage/methylation domain-containing protein [Phycisphaerae bacterium]|nr:prepilin-type N-terminal cleavage/methylation domain-containing protein [Phycisphaerae bacterium]
MPSPKKTPAFTLAEAILALAILAMLLAAVAVAVHASMQSYTENERIASVTQASRVILSRMMAEVRSAADVNSTDTLLTITTADDGSGLEQIQYEYTGGKLHYRRTVNGVQSDHVLLGDGADGIVISACSFVPEDSDDGVPLSRKVRLVLVRGTASFAVTASAAIRRNQEY